MAQIEFPNLSIKGAQGLFYERLEYGAAQLVWPKHCMMTTSDAATERYSFAGALPQPRRMLNQRQFQGMLDFTFTLENFSYELSFIVRREDFDDDQTGTINRRITELADAWNYWEDEVFSQLLENGNVAGNTAFDGTVFHGDTRVIGDSANIDNNTTSAAATGTIPTSNEFLGAMTDIKAAMWRFEDDSARQGFARSAMQQLRVIIPTTYERPAREALNATYLPVLPVAGTAAAAAQDNVYGLNLAQIDILPNLSSDAEMFVNACGGTTKPFLMQRRQPTEIVILNDTASVAQNNGVKVLTFGRFRFGYGDPRMSVLHTFS